MWRWQPLPFLTHTCIADSSTFTTEAHIFLTSDGFDEERGNVLSGRSGAWRSIAFLAYSCTTHTSGRIDDWLDVSWLGYHSCNSSSIICPTCIDPNRPLLWQTQSNDQRHASACSQIHTYSVKRIKKNQRPYAQEFCFDPALQRICYAVEKWNRGEASSYSIGWTTGAHHAQRIVFVVPGTIAMASWRIEQRKRREPALRRKPKMMQQVAVYNSIDLANEQKWDEKTGRSILV